MNARRLSVKVAHDRFDRT